MRNGIYTNAKPNSGVRRLRMVKRILKIISELTGSSLTVSQLACKLSVCERTIRRDLAVLVSELVVFRDENNKYSRNKNW